MLPKLIFCALLAAARTGGSDGAPYDGQAPSIFPQFSDLPSFDTQSNFDQPSISHKYFIDHVSPGTGSSPGSGGSSHTTGTRSSTLLNKAIAQQGASRDPAVRPSSSTDYQVAPPNFSSDPFGIPSIDYSNGGILSAGLFGTSIDKAIGSAPGVISLNSRIDHSSPGSISTVPNGISSHNDKNDGILSAKFLSSPFDKINVPVPEFISVSVSSSSDDDTHRHIPSSPVKISTANYANDGILSFGQLGTSLGKDVISIPNAVSINSVNGHGVPASISAATPDAAVPVKVSSSVGLAESSFLSSFGANFEKPSSVPAPDSITLRNIAAAQNEAPSVNYATEKVLVGPIVSQTATYNPTTLTSQDGLAENSFMSSFGAIVEKPSAVPEPDYIVAAQNEAPSVNYAAENVHARPVVSQAATYNPTTLASQAGLAESSFLSSFGAIVEKPSAVPVPDYIAAAQNEAPSVNYATEKVLVRPVVSEAATYNPTTLTSQTGLAESSFLSSFGANVEKPSAVPAPDSITLRQIAAAQNETPSVNYAAEKVLAGPVVSQAATSNPTTITSQSSIDKYLSTPASDLFGLLGNGYNSNPNGILSSGFLGAPTSSIFGFTGKELSANGLFSVSNIADNGNLGVGLTSAPAVGNKYDPLNKFETVIQHTAPSNVAAPTPFNGINNNNLFNGLIGNGISADPIGFPNGLFGSTYNGMNSFGGGNFAADNIFSKYFWR